MNIDWDKLFEFLTKILANCPAEGRVGNARNPLRQRHAVSRALRKQDFRGRDLRLARVKVLDRIRDTPDDEFNDFCLACECEDD